MPFKIGEIYTEVRAETGQFDKKMGSVKASFLAVGSAALVVINQVAQFGGMILRTASRAASAIIDLVRDTARAGDTMAKAARRIGISTETLSRYSFAANLAGTATRALEVAFKTLGMRANDVDDGLAETIRSFVKLGVEALDSEGNIRPLNELFMEVIQALSELENISLRNALANEIFGRSGLALIPMLDQGTDALKRQLKEADALGAVWGDGTDKMAEEFQDAITRMSAVWDGFKRVLFAEIGPGLTAMMNTATNAWKAHREEITGATNDLLDYAKARAEAALTVAMGEGLRGQALSLIPGVDLLRFFGGSSTPGAAGPPKSGPVKLPPKAGAAPAAGGAAAELYRLERQAFWRNAAVESMWDAVDAEKAWAQQIWDRESWEARLDMSLEAQRRRAAADAQTVREQIAIYKVFNQLIAERDQRAADEQSRAERSSQMGTIRDVMGSIREQMKAVRGRPKAEFTSIEAMMKKLQLEARSSNWKRWAGRTARNSAC